MLSPDEGVPLRRGAQLPESRPVGLLERAIRRAEEVLRALTLGDGSDFSDPASERPLARAHEPMLVGVCSFADHCLREHVELCEACADV